MSASPRVAAVFFGRPGAGGFNQAGVAGLARAAASHGLSPETVWEPEPARRAETLAAVAARADLVIAHGGQGEAGVAEVAPGFPRVAFAVTQGRIAGPNIACFEVLQEQSAFLAGALAGWWMPGRIAAHLSGEPVPPGLRGRAGFAAGLRHARPDAQLLTGFCGNQHDPPLAEAWTRAQAAAGAAVQFAMLDGGRSGAIAACKETGMRAIGNVRDWTEEDPVFLASAIAENGVTIEAAIAAFLAGRFADARIGLERPEAVRLALAREVSPALAERLEALRSEIIAGAVVVPEHYGGAEWRPE
ncbi:BMP family ABC transporter substrate-binding protein [Falsiroseomonas bella]|uniref:BMP family ABC transporter substrate-binding protein n=1 Tax=Falsiroseomonas bella TaxID=2184016 RepID=A0A317FA44_9PROT|nr:BMP family ABC transporter substrate-binding protein [Falsiroseomonas bella]PWS34789.1 BMP family ABC transporter substrate-binding protein [Falsiroseomonas bella]